MIVVIADDLSGAAELACVAAGYGLRSEVQTEFATNSAINLIAVDTDSRLLQATEAAKALKTIVGRVVDSQPSWIYKKTDSVLRGNVRVEIESILDVTGQPKALFVPANPSKNRIIRDGTYYVNNVALAKTAFARDPHHPAHGSKVAELLGPSQRIETPNTSSLSDIQRHAARIDSSVLPAGAVDFFEAILQRTFGNPINVAPLPKAHRTLFVCGSAAAWDQGRQRECELRQIPTIAIPENQSQWVELTIQALTKFGRAMVAIGRPQTQASSEQLLESLAEVVTKVLDSQPIDRLILEGGATAAAVLRKRGWTRLEALPTNLTGVAALRPPNGPLILTKPGSYPWPAEIYDDAKRQA